MKFGSANFPMNEICLVLTLLLALIFEKLDAFNLESRLPVIKLIEKDNYFGFSVAEHVITTSRDGRIPLILVGAPRAQTSQRETNRSGAVYKCPLTTIRKDCVQLDIETEGNLAPQSNVIKDDQWLGVSLKSQGPDKRVVTCAHRFIEKGPDYQWGRGKCFALTPNLDFERVWDPCLNRPVSKAHEEYGYCQAGTSVDISDENDIVIGAPGPYTWKGSVFTNKISFGFRDDRTWYMGPVIEGQSPVDKYSYLGMSVTTGKFFSDTNMTFVTGAPRSNGTGQVIFYSKRGQKEATFVTRLILNGFQFASSFGYTVETIDLNSDGFPDLVVGAPFYFDRDQGGAAYIYMNSERGISNTTDPIVLTGKKESRFSFSLANLGDLNKDGYPDLAIGAPYEGSGAVYIYLGSQDGIIKEPSQVLRVSELGKIESLARRKLTTFGYSLSGGVDMDNNGYPDLLIGAYESDSVILFRARPVIDIHTNVTGRLTNIDPNGVGCEEDPDAKFVCFPIKYCFLFNTTVQSVSTQIRLKYMIEAETFTGKKYYRVKFRSSLGSDRPNVVEGEKIVTYRQLFNTHCNDELVYLKDKSDIQNSIKFKLTYSIVRKDPEPPREGERLPDLHPILNQQEAARIFEAKFHKECGDNDECESELVVEAELNLPKEDRENQVLYLGEESLNMSLKIRNDGEPAYDAALYITHPYTISYIGRKVVQKTHSVECSPLNGTILKCDLGNPLMKGEMEIQIRFNPKGVSDDETTLKFDVKINTTSNNQAAKTEQLLVADIVRMAELQLRGGSEPEQVFYGGKVVGESAMVYEDEVGSPIVHTYELTNHGPWKARTVDVVVSWPYEVENMQEHGKWLLYLIEEPQVRGNGYCEMGPDQVNPLKLRENLDLKLQPIKKPEDDGSGGGVSNRDLMGDEPVSGERIHVRKRREVVIIPEELKMDGKTYKIVTMDCERGSAKCFKFRCKIFNLAKAETIVIKIRARLWNSTFVEDYPSVNWVSILSRARIELDPILDIKQSETNDVAQAETKAYPFLTLYQSADGVPIWIYILASCGGLLLLILLILCLWRLGFFKRKKPGYMVAPTHDKEKEANNL